ncbi:hypothetical protein [Allonocardiopsis opalescens]|uniref:Uncharacterized protein n=1 Tax=Allonocardiopsis opalescens TaxID=1144618 RepID=A0A2T0Q8D6_9ACTN|nr:hypothetical protein [Allonocardiopsis opalescens]PRY00080.1 hypothetical protein CLV72_103690 [Allonocardiopsis opalescens]
MFDVVIIACVTAVLAWAAFAAVRLALLLRSGRYTGTSQLLGPGFVPGCFGAAVVGALAALLATGAGPDARTVAVAALIGTAAGILTRAAVAFTPRAQAAGVRLGYLLPLGLALAGGLAAAPIVA